MYLGIPVPPEEDLHPNVAVLPELVATGKNPWGLYLLVGGLAYFFLSKSGKGRYNW